MRAFATIASPFAATPEQCAAGLAPALEGPFVKGFQLLDEKARHVKPVEVTALSAADAVRLQWTQSSASHPDSRAARRRDTRPSAYRRCGSTQSP
jgi:hypothetical protein